MDPGNWATDLTAGSKFGYALLFVILLSNCFALVMQYLCIKLGVVTGMDLAQACKHNCPKWLTLILYVLAETAIIATDIAEVIGSAIALNLLFGIPLVWGVVLTGLDVFLILFAYRDNKLDTIRVFEVFIGVLVTAVGICFVLEIYYSKPNFGQVMLGYLPGKMLVEGATLMPHNLYLCSSVVQARAIPGQNILPTISSTVRYTTFDLFFALTFALFVNSAILIVAAANFYYNTPTGAPIEVADIFDAHSLLSASLSPSAGTIFALALLLAGQSSTITATMAGSIVMEGFLKLNLKPWIRRIITRSLAIIPAMIVTIAKGREGLNDLLIASQVALSIQLPFAVVPLVWITSTKSKMKRMDYIELDEEDGHTDERNDPRPIPTDFSNNWVLMIVASSIAAGIIFLNGVLVAGIGS
ncbi:NRAMP family [Paraphysoderma sedebokerense]|nr:NRAMP family [Paraphysoderma sedebokerense]